MLLFRSSRQPCAKPVPCFCARRKIIPLEVGSLFGGFIPSSGHSSRICKILKSEMHRQARLYRQVLSTQLKASTEPSSLGLTLRKFLRFADQKTECLWQCQLRELRGRCSGTGPTPGNTVHSPENLDLPEHIHNVLALGPKFAVESSKRPEEMLSMVRQISKFVAEEDVSRVISEGVGAISRSRQALPKVSLRRVANYLRDNSICVLPADKEGGFCVLSEGNFHAKAGLAISAVFNRQDTVSLSKVKAKAKKLCRECNLDKVLRNIASSKRDHLEVFFSAKTHKPDVPLRVIVSEKDTCRSLSHCFCRPS